MTPEPDHRTERRRDRRGDPLPFLFPQTQCPYGPPISVRFYIHQVVRGCVSSTRHPGPTTIVVITPTPSQLFPRPPVGGGRLGFLATEPQRKESRRPPVLRTHTDDRREPLPVQLRTESQGIRKSLFTRNPVVGF